MTIARDITDVITAILAHVPESEKDLRIDLEDIHGKAMYTAPEVMRRRWHDLSALISREFHGVPLIGWQGKCVDILLNKATQ